MLIVKDSETNAAKLAAQFLNEGKAKNPIAIFVKDLTSAKKIFHFDKTANKIAKEYLSEGLTMVLETKPKAASCLTSNLNKNQDGFLGFRLVKTSFIKKLFKEFDGILAVTSANPSGQKAAINAKEVAKYFSKNKSVALLIDGGISKQKKSSTVVKISGGEVALLRQGLTKIMI
jgi:tRNA A37 threonylcarbamoyladenosine synthetase subunit TsaC/SUA5/YrdC